MPELVDQDDEVAHENAQERKQLGQRRQSEPDPERDPAGAVDLAPHGQVVLDLEDG